MSPIAEEKQETVAVTLRLPVELHDRARLAAAYGRTSVNNAIVQALDKQLPQLPADFGTGGEGAAEH